MSIASGLACGPAFVLDLCAKPATFPLESRSTWKLGYSVSNLYWEKFDHRKEAELRYQQLWWSKVLFDPEGKVVRCSSAVVDPKGVGVAKLLTSAWLGQSVENPSFAMENGELPFIPADRLPGISQALQVIWGMIATRSCISSFYPDVLCYFDVQKHPGVFGHVALSIDDAPCRLGAKNSMVPEIRTLLQEYQAQATFMVMGKFVPGNEQDLIGLLRDGNEFGNHGLVDKSYATTSLEEFESVVDECSAHITNLQRQAGVPVGVRWFRSPHGKQSAVMSEVLQRKSLTDVMCDTYACCPVIQDGDFIGSFLAKRATHGSIIILHMPEHGFREWCWTALQSLLKQLKERGMRTVSIGKLAHLAGWDKHGPCTDGKLAL